MKFQSEKLSEKVEDGLVYTSILSEINRVIYDNFINYLPFLNEINGYNENNFSNFIKEESLKILNERDIPKKIMDIYPRNVNFFKKKYSISEEQLNSLSSNSLVGYLILEKIFDDIQITNKTNDKKYFKEIVFGINDINIVECPIILQNKFETITYEVSSKGEISPNFFLTSDVNDFFIECVGTGQVLYDADKGNKYFFDKKYYDDVVVGKNLGGYGFHFEKFICFDFDEKNFFKKNTKFANQAISSQIDYEAFVYSCLNTALFLSENNSTNDIVVNPSYLKKIFPLEITNQTGYQELQNTIPQFIKNVRHGLRLVCRQTSSQDKTADLSYTVEEKNKKEKRLKKTFLLADDFSPIFKRPTSINNQKTKTVEKSFTSLEYSIIKNKSHILYVDVGEGIKNSVRRTWHPIVSVYHQEEEFRNNSSVEVAELLRFSESTLEILKEKIMETKEFKLIFSKLIPLDSLFILEKIGMASKLQDTLNFNLKEKPNQDTAIAKSLQATLLKTVDVMLKDKKEY